MDEVLLQHSVSSSDLMVSLGTHQACTPVEVLRASQGYHQLNCAQRAKTAVSTASTWNVRSMVNSEDPVEVESRRSNEQRGEDRKIVLIALELRRHNVSVGALQETKWFGYKVYEVCGSLLLTAGCPSPARLPVVRGEVLENKEIKKKCLPEREKPVHLQHGTVQCERCQRWF